jgi:hypothetical protein
MRNTELLWMLIAGALAVAWLARDKPSAAARARPAQREPVYEVGEQENDPGAEGP